jgi:phosphotriesterase-related protein
MNRREALQVLAGGLLATVPTRPRAQAAGFPKDAIIRTLLKDMPPGAIGGGAVLFHEHLSMRYPLGAAAHYTDDVAMMVEEARAAMKDGLACIVDGGHPDMGRNLEALKRIATESGLPVVASGGLYMQRSYPADVAAKSADQLADELAADARANRLGAFGEIGQQDGTLTADERKVFSAVGKAAARTGLPVFTHNAYKGAQPGASAIPPDAALRQLDLLEEAGASPAHVAIGHVCCLDDPKAEIASAIARRGAFVGFDRVTLPILPDAQKVVIIMAMIEAGHADKVLLSSDFASARSLKKNGGAGLNQTVTVFAPMLIKAGIGEATLTRILQDNPRRFLAFVPKV